MIEPRKQKDGSTRYRVRVGQGKETLGTYPTKDEARKAEARWLLGTRKRRTKLSVTDFLQGFERGERWDNSPVRESSNRTNFYTGKALHRWFHGVALSDVTHEMALAFAQAHPGRKHIELAKAVFADAERRRLIDKSPFAHLKTPKSRSRGKDRVLSVDDLDRLCEAARREYNTPESAYGNHFAAMITFAAYVGPRISMQLALTWEDVDLEQGTVTYTKSVDKRGRVLPWTKETSEGESWTVVLLPEAADALRALPRPIQKSERIWRGRRGQPLTPNAHHPIWAPVRSAAGLPHFPWHGLRHHAGWYFYVHLGLSDELSAHQLCHVDTDQIRSNYGHGRQDALARLQAATRGARVTPLQSVKQRAVGEHGP